MEVLAQNDPIGSMLWDDTKIPPGSDWQKEIEVHVARARMMIMLVSPDYLDPTCGARECETLPAIEAAKRGELTVLWLAVRRCDYRSSPVGKLMAALPPDHPLSEMQTAQERSEAWASLREQVIKVLDSADQGFDVFLSHNSSDKPAVRELAQALQQRGLKVWLDEWELPPGQPWQPAVEKIIGEVRSAAVLVGPSGLGPWEEPEMRACLDEFTRRKLPVIPVLLPEAPHKPDLPLFLRQFTWVDLREGLTAESLDRLEWGISGNSSSLSS